MYQRWNKINGLKYLFWHSTGSIQEQLNALPGAVPNQLSMHAKCLVQLIA